MQFNNIIKLNIFIAVLLLINLNFTCGAKLNFDTNESITNSFFLLKEETIDMADRGLPVIRIFNLVNIAEGKLESADYPGLKELSLQINNLTNKVSLIANQIGGLEIKIEELKKIGYNLSSEEEVFNKAVIEYNNENYEEAEISLKTITDDIDNLIIGRSEGLLEQLRYYDGVARKEKIETNMIQNLIQYIIKARREQDYSTIIQIYNELNNINNSVGVFIEINDAMEDMNEKGRSNERIKDIKLEATDAFNDRNYENVILVYDEFTYLMEVYKNTEELINLSENKLKELEFIKGTARAKDTLNLSVEEFENENYEDAQELAQESYDLLENLEAQSLLFGAVSVQKIRFSIISYFKEKLWLLPIIILFSVIAIFILIKIAKIILIIIYKKRINAMEKEKKIINSLIKRNQLEYYVKQLIDKDTYDAAMHKYQERLVKINQKIPVFHERINRIKKAKK